MKVIAYTKPTKKIAKFWWVAPLGVGIGIVATLVCKTMKK